MTNFGTILLVVVIYITVLISYCRARRSAPGGVIYKNAIVLYAIVLLLFKFLPETGEHAVRLVPLAGFFYSENVAAYALELLLSVLLFVPLGFLSGMQSCLNGERSALLKTVLLGAVLALVAELFQLLPIGKMVSIDHFLCNTLGACFGFLIFSLLVRSERMQRALKSILYP